MCEIACLAKVDATDSTLASNLSGTGLPANQIFEEGIYVEDGFNISRNVVMSGMTLGDLLGNSDDRVIIDLEFIGAGVASSDSLGLINLDDAREARSAGHQDGRRTGITDTTTSFTNDETCKKIKVAFAAVFYDSGTPTGEERSEGAFVAEIESCEPEECTSCLCSTDPECMFGGMALGAGPDFNGDETVDGTDLELMMKAYGYTKGRFDLNEDGIVDSLDVDALLKDWGAFTKE